MKHKCSLHVEDQVYSIEDWFVRTHKLRQIKLEIKYQGLILVWSDVIF